MGLHQSLKRKGARPIKSSADRWVSSVSTTPPRQIWAPLREAHAVASRARLLAKAAGRRGNHPMFRLHPPPPPSRSRSPSPSPAETGCAASTDRAERWRRGRGRALGHSEASTTGLLAVRQQGQEAESVAAAAGMKRGCKVAPVPKEQGEAAPALTMPGSPSFRFYCQKTASVDALVADADGGDSDGSVRITGIELFPVKFLLPPFASSAETAQAPKTNELTVKGIEASKPKV
ncbi:uncharacterized protein LOC133908310 [Phragmites australis]|uniref:uncharacterized protein LOC133908310 n=1 Tax=Phragmites australis TaxID=29695 RepID=UPI002D777E1D|nr:uncharacterized protein LOC133908310 [Phragmites australis]